MATLISASTLVIFAGFLCLWDPELAWNLYELDSRLIGVDVVRPKLWRRYVTITGNFLLTLGVLGIFASIVTVI